MIKRTITYVDFNDVERTEDFFFHLNKAEVAEMEMSVEGGLSTLLEKIVKSKSIKGTVEYFKDFILRSYGEKSVDGKRFIKNQELRDAFTQTEAYSQLFMELATDEKKAIAFVNGVIPQMPNDKPAIPHK